jgi:pimeloyl-ACP methyl ester carboxylesterase
MDINTNCGIHILPANGMLAEAYDPLVQHLHPHPTTLSVYPIPSQIPTLLSWHYFLDTLRIPTTARIGIGHSLGGTLLLAHALQSPHQWDTIVVVEPALFTPSLLCLYRWVQWFHLENVLHPMVRATHHRRVQWENSDDIFRSWRKKPIFSSVPDTSLMAIIQSNFESSTAGVHLRFPKEWECAIYKSMGTLDHGIWKGLPTLRPRLVVVAGETSTTFLTGARQKIAPFCHTFVTLKSTTHLLPFEKPKDLARIAHWSF